MRNIGVISDTHGLLRPSAIAALSPSDLIIHAGDVGRAEILEELAIVASVVAVRGNIDKAALAEKLREREVLELDGFRVLILHDLAELNLDPRQGRFQAVIFGHSHQPLIDWRDGVLYFNPGSAGPRRFRLPVTVGRLTIAQGEVSAKIINIETEFEKAGASPKRLLRAMARAARGVQNVVAGSISVPR
ncbi:MAG: metallophosphoesterase family protein [Hyphomicrobiales bacterium]|nr:metallophosphoesterase family protein [Acidobacteriaceae bacterium]MBV9754771.1 metallophosphoesterase family protein [Hyphomicrobiales bacterium]